jgi:hypothetical protein
MCFMERHSGGTGARFCVCTVAIVSVVSSGCNQTNSRGAPDGSPPARSGAEDGGAQEAAADAGADLVDRASSEMDSASAGESMAPDAEPDGSAAEDAGAEADAMETTETGAGDGTAGPDAMIVTTESDECGRIFDAIYACGTQVPPKSELSLMRARFQQVCSVASDMPGNSLKGPQLAACVAAYEAAGCSARAIPAECRPPGTNPSGSTCASGNQCSSRSCVIGVGSADGSSQSNCGTCSPTCSSLTVDGCLPGTGDIGASCNTSKDCKPNLRCSGGTCSMPGDIGASCSAYISDCLYPLVCASGTCANPGTAGSPCAYDSLCAAGFACDQTSMQCETIAWASAGQPCGGSVRCLVGNCSSQSSGGQCPAVIPDGEACGLGDPTKTCDWFAVCESGVCTLGASTSCR